MRMSPNSPDPAPPTAGVAEDNRQTVLRVSNRVTLAQCWYNEERTRKPQTFAAAATDASAFDPTDGGAKGCDFCDWQQLTAADTWGRRAVRGGRVRCGLWVRASGMTTLDKCPF